MIESLAPRHRHATGATGGASAATAAAMTVAEVAEQARAVLLGTPEAAFVLLTASRRIIAAAPAAARLLDPAGGDVVGHRFDEYATDAADAALALFADGQVNGYEAVRALRRSPGPDLPVSFWVRRFEHQAASRVALVLADAPDAPLAPPVADPPVRSGAVVGTVSRSGLVEQVSGGTTALFGAPPRDLLGRPVGELVAAGDATRWHAATTAASTGDVAVTVTVRTRSAGQDGGAATGTSTRCDVLLLPLRPGFTFVVLPVDEAAEHAPGSGDVRSMLMTLARVAGLAQAERERTAGLQEADLPGLASLTARERDIFTRLVSGYRVSSIAGDLVLSPSTVRTHLTSIFAKLGVSNQDALLAAVRATRPHRTWGLLYGE